MNEVVNDIALILPTSLFRMSKSEQALTVLATESRITKAFNQVFLGPNVGFDWP